MYNRVSDVCRLSTIESHAGPDVGCLKAPLSATIALSTACLQAGQLRDFRRHVRQQVAAEHQPLKEAEAPHKARQGCEPVCCDIERPDLGKCCRVVERLWQLLRRPRKYMSSSACYRCRDCCELHLAIPPPSQRMGATTTANVTIGMEHAKR